MPVKKIYFQRKIYDQKSYRISNSGSRTGVHSRSSGKSVICFTFEAGFSTTETQSGTQRTWEHRVIIRSIFSTEKQLERDLSQLGSEGFEVCGMTVKERDIVIALRRPGR